MKSNPLTLRARYIFPVESDPIAEGLLMIRGGRIVSVQPAGTLTPDLDLGNVAITPGFVNAHTHLELSAIEPPSPSKANPSENEIEWLGRVVEQRHSGSLETLQARIQENLSEAIQSGTTMLADTTTAGLSWPAITQAPIRATVFAELIGLKRMRGLETIQSAWDWIESIGPLDQNTINAKPGLSPHAPYSTSEWLYHRAASSRLPLSTHLAEMPEEFELLETRQGPLREFLEQLGAWDDSWEPLSPAPADYVRKGALREADWILAHGTYLEPNDYWQLRPEASNDGHRVAVAYCPRTHARFGHRPHPFHSMLERGVIVCLGTDSLASNPSLSILDEMRFLRAEHPEVSGALILTMGTLFGAWALKAEGTTGSLKAGKAADLAVLALPEADEADPYDLLFKSELPVVASAFEGRFQTFIEGSDLEGVGSA